MSNQYKLFVFAEKSNDYRELEIETSDMLTVISLENIQDISTRKDTITKDLTVQGTPNNNQVLGNLYDISRYSAETYSEELGHNFVANRYVKCVLLENNIQILKGKLLVKDIVINSSEIMYVCGIVGSLVSFFADLKERELTDLDSINNNVAYNLNTIENSWTTPNLNYLFPQLDYGIDERPKYIENDIEVEPNHWDNSYDFKNYRPALYVKTYLDAIFNGFRYNSTTGKYTQLDNNNQP